MNKLIVILIVLALFLPVLNYFAASATADFNISNPRFTFSLQNPSGTPNFSNGQIEFQKAEGIRIRNEIIAAAQDLSKSVYIIPEGNYGFSQSFFKNATTNGFLLDGIKRPDTNPFTIKAYGVTFWFDIMNAPAPTWGRAVYFNNCENITLEGLTVDTYVRNAIEGTLTNIDVANNRIEITLLEGTFNDEAKILAYNDTTGTQSRIIPVKPNGNFIAPLYNINNTWGPEYLFIKNITKSGTNKYWLNFKNDQLLKTIFTSNWLNAYGNGGTLQPGDGICLLYGVMGGFVVDNSKQITIKDSNCYIAKGSIFEDGGYGNHKWINVKMMPRPGTNQILGGGENMSQGLRVGSTYDNCYFGLTSDDAINIHGFWGVAQSISAKSVVFDKIPTGITSGDTVEFYDTTNGQKLYTYTVNTVSGPLDTDINGNRRNNTVTFNETPDSSVVTQNSVIVARYPNAECAGWVIKNCIFESNYQRILLQSGSGLFENNIVNCMGSGLHLNSNFYSLEGGYINNITIRNNTFINSSLSPNSSLIYAEFTNKTTQTQWTTDISISGNILMDSGGESIKLVNAKNVTINKNILIDPLRYTAISNPYMQRAATAVTGTNTSNVIIRDNFLYEKTAFTSGIRFYNSSGNLINNVAKTISNDLISQRVYDNYKQSKSSNEIIDSVIEAEGLIFLSPPDETPSDSSTLNDLAIIGKPFTENFTKNALGSLWSYDLNHFSIIENSQSIAGKSVKQDFSNAANGCVYAFDTKNKLTAGGTYKLSVNYKVLSDTIPTAMFFGFARDGFANQKNAQINFEGKVKNQVYTFIREFTLDNFGDYYLQWFNLDSDDGSVIVIDTLRLERLSSPTPPITFHTFSVSGSIVNGLSQQMTKSAFLQKVSLADMVTVKFLDKNNIELSDASFIGTNTTVQVLLDGTEIASYKTVVTGDLDEDGRTTITDLILIRKYLLKSKELYGILINAADFTFDSNISLIDLLMMKTAILNS